MQSRGSSAAPAQRPSLLAEQMAAATGNQSQGHQAQHASSEQTNTWFGKSLDQLAEMATLGLSVKEHYIGQVKLTGQMAKAEWQLTERSLALAAVLMVCFGAGIILLWGSVLLMFGALLFSLSNSVAITAGTLMILQLALLVWCWRSLSYVLSKAGFSQTWQQVQRLFFQPQQESSHGD
ncbi:MAG: hypothetical protein KJ930_02090 [Gammaproteobacteria bacterium]|jgi:hypothetical protein|nr:hypothetical protein [Gammaproteobacteria bacterium]